MHVHVNRKAYNDKAVLSLYPANSVGVFLSFSTPESQENVIMCREEVASARSIAKSARHVNRGVISTATGIELI